ncbi:hypothetical protein ACF06P_06015 [Streptomyces sp. NPDC015684]|uniref:hypothetical protein n=1 Tax=Streptomyces sp. NPDC015684 TaxID=3364963 RepID=UPI00370292CB
MPARLHRRLAGADDGPEVLSFAVPGGWSRGESAMLLYRLRHARPDCVVTLSGRNDFDTLFAMDLVNGPGAQVLNWTFSDYHHYLRIHAPHEIDDTHVPFARKPSVLRSLPHLDSAVFPRSGARLRGSQWLDNQALMATVCEQQGSHFVCALQPHSLLQPALGTEVTRNWVTSHYDFAFTGGDGQPGRAGLFDAYADSIASVYQVYRQGLAELSARFPTATFLDLSTVYADEDAPCFLDGVHLSPHGADVLADALRRPREGAGAADGRRPPRKRNRAVPDGGREPGHRVFRARGGRPATCCGATPFRPLSTPAICAASATGADPRRGGTSVLPPRPRSGLTRGTAGKPPGADRPSPFRVPSVRSLLRPLIGGRVTDEGNRPWGRSCSTP